ncbi:MAG: DUF2267 domain-containing protein [Cyanobacteria bacterium QH_8_48_120]|jgi:uncharacterized protein (DUF2267 family)|nr:MAG: DUF2267 domain-containing protein [Cyanobacteria bacterium QH_1_48_107]PSO65450.1 MAG: DUF2267 domain-containing protein [Cyanobacteria bacterium QH_6_48_35]PSO73436.1 MAG: DUF2267 domain-containing protein [Cyanobacteria bacterium QH_8_48_120]PSP05298.1 MAG: DUF2267 domain-containing protein [Cyanobacteria bacterium QS_7_48_42]PSP34811.1 MAG: DUF2267 domain-containing protein [Cyanobacteria bacterium QS_8_48_54]
MPIQLREDVMYILLDKIDQGDQQQQGKHGVSFQGSDFAGRQLTPSDFLGHLDYLNQKQYIDAEFKGNAYANQEDVPDVIEAEELDFRVANTLGAEDGPLPHLIRFKKAELTEKGQKLLEKMRANKPEQLAEGPTSPIASHNQPFLEKVMTKGGLEDIFDARDMAEVVFRTMRDLMTTEETDRVARELHEPAEPTKDKLLQNEVAELWKDTNPIVRFLSRVRPPLKIDSDTFLRRIEQEGSLSPNLPPEEAVNAVFFATKDELSEEKIQEIAGFLPDGIREIWERA